jgi:trigger factor
MTDHAHDHRVEVKKVDRLGPTEVQLTIALPADVVTKEEARTAQKYARQAQLPGFRPGKAPLAMIQKKFQDNIRRDVLSHLIEAGLTEALGEAKLVPVSEPEIQVKEISFGEGKAIEFQAKFEIEPEIALKKYKGATISKAEAGVTDADVEETLERLRDRMAVLEPSTAEVVEKGSFAETEMSFVTTDDKAKAEMPQKAFTVEVGNGKLLAEIEDSLLGMKPGEEKEVNVSFPADYFEASLSGRPATFKVKVLELKKKTMPELNDEFANSIKAGSTVASLKEEIRADIEQNKKEESRKAHRQQILDYLIENNPFGVPKAMVARQAQRLLQSMEEDFKRRGSQVPGLDEDQRKALAESAERIVKSSLLLRAVAEKEKIELEPAKFRERIDSLAKGTQQTPEQVEKFLESQGILNRMKDEALTDQVFDFLISNAEMRG